MKKNRTFNKILYLVLFVFIFTSCMPEDSPVAPFDRGDKILGTIEMGGNYEFQLFYNLDKAEVISSSNVKDWDLAFDCSDDSFIIMLNMASFMSATNFGSVPFESVTSHQGAVWRNEMPEAYTIIDSAALGIWYENDAQGIITKGEVYIINRGYDHLGRSLGYKKFIVEDFNVNSYFVRFADLNGNNEIKIEIQKQPEYNYIALSFTSGEILYIEPPKRDWDILFTKYTYFFYMPDPIPYSVTGVLLNPKYVLAAIEKEKSYDEITFDVIENYEFSNKMDIIGYEWKYYDFEAGVYLVNPNIIYIIIDNLGFYYKLHFIDFYSNTGERGYPSFEFEKL